MGGRQKESDTSCADIYPRQSAQASQETGTRRGPSYLVHVKRNPFHDPALPPFWELTVENARHRYRVLVGVPADELDLVIQSLPEPTPERHGVDFRRGVTEVILPRGYQAAVRRNGDDGLRVQGVVGPCGITLPEGAALY